MTRATLRLLAKPEPVAAVARPVYPRWSVCQLGPSTDRRAAYYARRDTQLAEWNQAAARWLSRLVRPAHRD